MKQKLLMLIALLLSFPSYGYSQLWSNTIATGRATDWSTAGVEGGIPSATWTQCGPTIAPYTGSGQTIQTAINNCAANHYVLLGPGTFNLSSGFSVSKSGVAVRGSGADQTFLIIAGDSIGASCGYFYSAAIKLCASSGVPQNTGNWTAGYAPGTTRITLSNTSGIAVGTVLLLDQLDDQADGWPAAGDVYICSAASSSCSAEGGGTGFGRAGRAVAQAVKVTNVAGGGQFDISPPISLPNFRADRSPGAVWAASVSNILVGSGVENLSVDFTGVGQLGFEIVNALNSWVRGVRSVYNGGAGSFINHYEIINGLHITVKDNYLYGPTSVQTTTYPMSPNNASSILIENNIFQSITGDVVSDGPFANSVVSYNFFPGHTGPGAILHGAGELMDLYEGNVWLGWWSDVNHGTHAFQTIFRNAMIGHRYIPSGASVAINNPVQIQSRNRFTNVVGNVMGDTNLTTYEVNQADNSSAIYGLGWQGNASGSVPPNDPNVKRTLLRWGNWDSVTSTSEGTDGDQTGVRWCGSAANTGWTTRCGSTTEVPSGIPNFANPIPAAETLVASFYYASRPSWWPTTKPWPAIGPDVKGGNISNMGGHAYTNPAADCYLRVMGGPADGSGSPLRFNADACYGASATTSTPPAAPTGVKVVVQ